MNSSCFRASFACLLSILMFVSLFISCGNRQQLRLDTGWSPPETFGASGYVVVSRLNGVPVCIDGNDYYFLEDAGRNWTKRSFLPTVEIANSRPQPDAASSRFLLHDGNANFGNVHEGGLHARIACCSLDSVWGIRTIFDRRFTLNTDEILETNRTPTCDIPFPPIWKQYGPPRIWPAEGRLGGSVILGKDVYVAYTIRCNSVYGSNMVVNSTGPNQAGLLHSKEDGSRWTKLKLLDAYTSRPGVFATRENLYFLGCGGGSLEKIKSGLWSVRLRRTVDSQSDPEIVTPTCPGGNYSAITESDTIHLTWLDSRHQRYHNLRAMLTDTSAAEGNWELYYRSRKDSDTAWMKEALLSKGLDFTYDPQIAVEGEHVVVVCGGYSRDTNRAVARLHPSDIYYTTSHDGGKSWKPMLRVTDRAKAGQTSIDPQVVLYKGVIHLFYNSGTLIYQRRPFPEDQ